MQQTTAGQNYREIRKIQLTGKSTFILSLPKKWIKEMHLAPGDQVALVRDPDTNYVSMIVDSGKTKTSTLTGAATVFVLSKDGPEALKRKIIAMYLAGYTIINLRAKSGRISASLREAVREMVRKNLIGTEIIADSSDEITLQVLLALPELSVATALKRMYLIASSMHRDALASLAEKNNRSIAEGVIRTDDEVDRFGLYISRNLALALRSRQILEELALQEPSNCLSYRIAVKSIERIGDHAVGIAEKALVIKTVSGALMEKLSMMSEHSLSVLEDSVAALLKRDYELAESTVDRAAKIYGLENEVLALVENKETATTISDSIRLIVEDIRRTAEYASDIAEAAINETIVEIISKEEPLLPQQRESGKVSEGEGQEKEKEGQNSKLVKGATQPYHV